MKFLIVLCLGALALSAPAPQKRNQIDFLFDDDETQASVRPVEASTVEPKVTATKISDPRQLALVSEQEEPEEEEEADIQEQEPSPIASPFNLEPSESDNSEPSAEVNETDSDDLENKNITQSNATESDHSSVTDTTIRVYDDDELNGTTEKEQRMEHDNEQDDEQAQEQEREQEQTKIDQSNEKALVDDSYQYDDESLEKEFQSEEGPERTTTVVPEPSSDKPAINGELNNESQVADRGNFETQDLKPSITIPFESDGNKYAGLVDWNAAPRVAVSNDNSNVELKTGQVFNHGTLYVEKGTFDGQDVGHPFNGNPFPMRPWKMGEKPDFADWPHGPWGHGPPHGPPGHPHFPPPHDESHRYEGPPPSWLQGHHSHPHRFDHNTRDYKGFTFQGNGFHRNVPAWDRPWENRHPLRTTTEGSDLSQ